MDIIPLCMYVCMLWGFLDQLESCTDETVVESIRLFSYEELKSATQGFRPSCKIGEGGFGSVYKVIIMLYIYWISSMTLLIEYWILRIFIKDGVLMLTMYVFTSCVW